MAEPNSTTPGFPLGSPTSTLSTLLQSAASHMNSSVSSTNSSILSTPVTTSLFEASSTDMTTNITTNGLVANSTVSSTPFSDFFPEDGATFETITVDGVVGEAVNTTIGNVTSSETPGNITEVFTSASSSIFNATQNSTFIPDSSNSTVGGFISTLGEAITQSANATCSTLESMVTTGTAPNNTSTVSGIFNTTENSTLIQTSDNSTLGGFISTLGEATTQLANATVSTVEGMVTTGINSNNTNSPSSMFNTTQNVLSTIFNTTENFTSTAFDTTQNSTSIPASSNSTIGSYISTLGEAITQSANDPLSTDEGMVTTITTPFNTTAPSYMNFTTYGTNPTDSALRYAIPIFLSILLFLSTSLFLFTLVKYICETKNKNKSEDVELERMLVNPEEAYAEQRRKHRSRGWRMTSYYESGYSVDSSELLEIIDGGNESEDNDKNAHGDEGEENNESDDGNEGEDNDKNED
ncbi:hypothetical protein C922_00422 [Plasmodium inui San Antonio 1]|uniref:Uncharacterized protein n=1 Tax=Plasmodium inui San Antonio 1 TaxID=1237626 RepID=W7AE54_9APIC|nr:hypothetical protein C922_00422 [Plasmodium inui San Antonio 1]EUD69558.1 hypothetical protein C922_00422 [Plasmodium inui San Antonio 1]